jgi:hypothetical protein
MASTGFSSVLYALNMSKNLDKVIVGGDYLPEGTYEVSIQAIDTSHVHENKLAVTYATEDGKTYTDRMFTTNQAQTEVSYSIRALWSAVLADKDAIGKLIELSAENPKAQEMLTGMKLKITLKYGKGIQAHSIDGGKFVGIDNETGEVITQEYDNIKEVYEEVKARALKRSYLQVKKSEITDKEGNLKAFWFAVDQKTKNKTGITFVV